MFQWIASLPTSAITLPVLTPEEIEQLVGMISAK